ncbi:MAG: single-stranded DNA-binding protein [Oscillospiraceae bacterium]|nr:single-stranded DNA-binding protein [Oscillospiraceae bacterium]
METTQNHVQLRGTAVGEPAPSHENHGQRFYRFQFAVRRLSGQTDTLWVIATGGQLRRLIPLTGRRLAVDGQLRSFNNKTGSGSRLVISVFAQIIGPAEGDDLNAIHLRGVICKPPVLRRTPLGRCISDMMLAVNRRYGRADYLPCIAWGQVAMITGHMQVGDPLALEGRVQSRVYTKVVEGCAEERTAFEVSVMHLVSDA